MANDPLGLHKDDNRYGKSDEFWDWYHRTSDPFDPEDDIDSWEKANKWERRWVDERSPGRGGVGGNRHRQEAKRKAKRRRPRGGGGIAGATIAAFTILGAEAAGEDIGEQLTLLLMQFANTNDNAVADLIALEIGELLAPATNGVGSWAIAAKLMELRSAARNRRPTRRPAKLAPPPSRPPGGPPLDWNGPGVFIDGTGSYRPACFDR